MVIDVVSFLICSDEYRDIPVVMVTEIVTSANQTKRSVAVKSTSPLTPVKEGDILSVTLVK